MTNELLEHYLKQVVGIDNTINKLILNGYNNVQFNTLYKRICDISENLTNTIHWIELITKDYSRYEDIKILRDWANSAKLKFAHYHIKRTQ